MRAALTSDFRDSAIPTRESRGDPDFRKYDFVIHLDLKLCFLTDVTLPRDFAHLSPVKEINWEDGCRFVKNAGRSPFSLYERTTRGITMVKV